MIPVAPPVPATAASSVGTSFQAPPGWDVPRGFDPRRGHLVDPAWPAAPADWQFWGPSPRPRGFLPWVRRVGWGPLVLGTILLLVVVAVATTDDTTSSQGSGVGSCWSAQTPTSEYFSIDCDSPDAQYQVVSEVGSAEDCGTSSDGYFEVGDIVQCLREVG